MTDMFKDDVTKQWSLARVSAAVVLAIQLGYSGFVVVTSKTLPDLQAGWLTFLLAIYGINKAASAGISIAGGKDA